MRKIIDRYEEKRSFIRIIIMPNQNIGFSSLPLMHCVTSSIPGGVNLARVERDSVLLLAVYRANKRTRSTRVSCFRDVVLKSSVSVIREYYCRISAWWEYMWYKKRKKKKMVMTVISSIHLSLRFGRSVSRRKISNNSRRLSIFLPN